MTETPFFFGPLSVGDKPVGDPQLGQIFDQLRQRFPGLQGQTTYAGAQGAGTSPAIGFSLDYNPFQGASPTSLNDVFSNQLTGIVGRQDDPRQPIGDLPPMQVIGGPGQPGGSLSPMQPIGDLPPIVPAIPPSAITNQPDTGMSDTEKALGAASVAVSAASLNPIGAAMGLVELAGGKGPLHQFPTPWMRFGGNLKGTLDIERRAIDMLGQELQQSQTQGDVHQAIDNFLTLVRHGDLGGDVVGGFGIGSAPGEIPNLPGAGGSEHEWGQTADFGPQVAQLRQLIASQLQRLPQGATTLRPWSDVIQSNLAQRDAADRQVQLQQWQGAGYGEIIPGGQLVTSGDYAGEAYDAQGNRIPKPWEQSIG